MGNQQKVLLPDIGDFADVDVAEVLVTKGQRVAPEQSLIVLESDKASMEIPSPIAGVVVEIKVSVGDRVSEGALIAIIEADEAPAETEAPAQPAAPAKREEPAKAAAPARAPEPERAPEPKPAAGEAIAAPEAEREPEPEPESESDAATNPALLPHASPSVRRVAREMGVDLRLVPGTGPKARITPDDVRRYVKSMIEKGTAAGVPISGVSIAAPPQIDFAKFGPTEIRELHRIRKLSAANLHRSWVTIPHVTQHDEADITDLDEFRREMKPEAEARKVKLTFLPFVLKACVYALKEHPQFNASLDHTGENLILKRYYHVGVAVDTENGLVVPVVRDADRKGLYETAAELAELSAKARSRKLTPGDLQGASFSISSLGGIGGTFFTPIVNHPEVAILGVGKMDWRPVYRDGAFVPRLVLPLSLSYDHRVIDGADAARFTTRLAELLSDLRRLIL
jgi:pyruvate dehydrogenase E2 component (dihydrolipoyllysine-residue acetyltransferase)